MDGEECGKFEPAGAPVAFENLRDDCGFTGDEAKRHEREKKDAGHDFSRWQSEQVAEKATAEAFTQ
jgi:hypothetical protein